MGNCFTALNSSLASGEGQYLTSSITLIVMALYFGIKIAVLRLQSCQLYLDNGVRSDCLEVL